MRQTDIALYALITFAAILLFRTFFGICLLVVCAAALTVPSDDSFKSYLKQTHQNSDSNDGWFKKTLAQLFRAEPTTVVTDYKLFKLAEAKQGPRRASYVGVFGVWLPITGETVVGAESGCASFGGLASDEGEAVDRELEILHSAAIRLKANRDYKEASKKFLKSAELTTGVEQAQHFLNAANALKADGDPDASGVFMQAGEAFQTAGRLAQASRAFGNAGDLASRSSRYDLAANLHLRAAEGYRAEDQPSSQMNCLRKAAEAYCELGDLFEAARLFEDAACVASHDRMLRYQCLPCLFMAALCRLALPRGHETAAATLERFVGVDPSFETTKQYDLCRDLANAVADGDADSITAHCYTYDQVHRLSKLETALLLRIKELTKARETEVEDVT